MVVVLGAVFLATTGALSSWNIAREEGKDAAVRGNIDTILTQARYGGSGAADGAGCAAGLFNDPTIAAALDAIRVASDGEAAHCVANADGYAVSAPRPSLGFYRPPTRYWCGDSTPHSCGTEAQPDAAAPVCACTAP